MNQESRPRNQDSPRKTMNVEDTSSKAMVAIDGVGLFAPPTIDLSNSGLEEFQHPEFKRYRPKDILTKSGIVPISTDRHSSSRAAAPVSAARPINTAASKPLVNVSKPRQNALQTSHSLSRRPFYQQTSHKNKNLNNNVNNAKENSVNTAKGNKVASVIGKQGINVVKSSACWVWRPKIKVQDHVSKNSGSYICKQFDYVDPEGNISYLTDFKEHDGGYVAFRGEAKGGKITGKGKSSMETRPSQDYILMPLWKENSLFDTYSQASDGHNKDKHVNSATPTYIDFPNDPLILDLEDTRIFDDAYDDRDEGAEADYNNLETVISIRPIPSTRIHKDHPKEQILREVNSAIQTKKMAK
nr:hypothetical protein [Tanacetum cinerariifolium]